jgi:hypothetical protein
MSLIAGDYIIKLCIFIEKQWWQYFDINKNDKKPAIKGLMQIYSNLLPN